MPLPITSGCDNPSSLKSKLLNNLKGLKKIFNLSQDQFKAEFIKVIRGPKQQERLVENVKNMVSVLMKPENLEQEGVLRVSASKKDLGKCLECIVFKTVSLEKSMKLLEDKGIHTLAGCLKAIISAMPFILDEDLEKIKATKAAAETQDLSVYNDIYQITKKAIELLPKYQQDIVDEAMNYFFMLGEHDEAQGQSSSKKNKMTHRNIATVVTPILYQSSVPNATELTKEQFLEMSELATSLPLLVELIILSWGRHSGFPSNDNGFSSLGSSWESIPLSDSDSLYEKVNSVNESSFFVQYQGVVSFSESQDTASFDDENLYAEIDPIYAEIHTTNEGGFFIQHQSTVISAKNTDTTLDIKGEDGLTRYPGPVNGDLYTRLKPKSE